MINFRHFFFSRIPDRILRHRHNIVIILIFVLYLCFIWNFSTLKPENELEDDKYFNEHLPYDRSLFRPSYEYNSVENNFTPSSNKTRYFRYNINLANASQIDTQKDIDSIPESEFDLVLLWTRYFKWTFLHDRDSNADNFKYDITKKIHRPAYCMDMYPNCRITQDRRLFNQSNMIIFHWQNIIIKELPKHRFPEQIWQLYIQESPNFTPHLPDRLLLYFNSTSLYHSGSDMRVPYGETERLENLDYVPDVSEKEMYALWMASDCWTFSKRERYIYRLKLHIPIDILGQCSNYNQCRKQDFADCQKKLFKKYYFYMSFENSFCDEYVTEKLFVTMQKDIVPIVYGGANYSAILPPHSFIDATKYSPDKLAKYMKYLVVNRTAYLEYFEWKRHFIIRGDRNPTDHLYCEACRYVQEYKRGNIARKSVSLEQINKFWFSTCWDTQRVHKVAYGT